MFDRRSSGCWAQEVSERFPDLRMEVISVQSVLGLSKWVLKNPEMLLEAFDSCINHPSLIGIQKLQKTDLETSILVETRCKCDIGCVHPLLQKYDCHYLLPHAIITEKGRRRYHILVTNEKNLESLLCDLRRSGEAEVVSIRSLSSSVSNRVLLTSNVAQELTKRQRQTLLTAYRLGYYNIPRTVTMSEIGKELGLKKATVHEHLRKAERLLMKYFTSFLV